MWSDGVAAEGLAAVDADEVAVDVAGLVGGQEHGETGDVVDLAPALEGYGFDEELVEVFVVEQGAGQGGLGEGGADAVGADAVLAVLDGQAAGELGLGALGDVVD